jgi:hypothetical protein
MLTPTRKLSGFFSAAISPLLFVAVTVQVGVAQNDSGPKGIALPHSTLQAEGETENEDEIENDAAQMDRFLTRLALDNMPVEFKEDEDWGQQDERWDGVKVSFKNGKLRTKRRKKMVNHGTWKRYSASLVDPEEQFSVQLNNFRELADRKVAFDVVVSAKIKVAGRQSKWVKGMQLYSISATGSADLRLTVSVELQSTLDVAKFPPDLILDPAISAADIELFDFRIDRVSKAGGEIAQQITKAVRKAIEKKISAKEEKLVSKLNTKIDENRDRLTLSAHDAMKSKWASLIPGNNSAEDDQE